MTPTRRRAFGLVIPGGLLVAYVAAVVEYLRPPMPQDAMSYFERAAHFPDVSADHWSLRLGLLLPVRALQWLFGYSEVAYYVLPVVSGAVLILGTYWLGRRLFTPIVGAGAALVLLMSGPFLTHATALLPDQFAAALFVSALALVLVAGDRPQPWTRSTLALLVGAGALLGWAYLVREFVPLLFPLVLVVLRSRSAPRRAWAWVAAPLAAVIVGEMVLNWMLYGSPIERFVSAGRHGNGREFLNSVNRYDALVQVPRTLWELPGGRGLAVLSWAVPFTVLLWRRPGFKVVGVWCALYWVPLTLATGFVDPDYRVFPGNSMRYWMPMLPALAIGGLAVVNEALSTVAARGRVAVVAALAAAAAILAVHDLRDVAYFRSHGATQLHELRAWLAGDGAEVDVVWTDRHTARLMPLYWTGEVSRYEVDDEGVAAVLYSLEGDASWADLPTGWRVVLARDDRTLIVYRPPAAGTQESRRAAPNLLACDRGGFGSRVGCS